MFNLELRVQGLQPTTSFWYFRLIVIALRIYSVPSVKNLISISPKNSFTDNAYKPLLENMTDTTKFSLRQSLKSKRLGLEPLTRTLMNQNANRYLIEFLAPHIHTQRDSMKIALFSAFNGEIDPNSTIEYLLALNISIYLPVIHPFSQKTLLFQKYTQKTDLHKNKFGIKEPKLDVTAITPLEQIHFFVMPLTGYDKQGNRLGMGGGFYDKTLSQCRDSSRLIGFAYSVQEVETIPTEPWDIRLGHIVTDAGYTSFPQEPN